MRPNEVSNDREIGVFLLGNVSKSETYFYVLNKSIEIHN